MCLYLKGLFMKRTNLLLNEAFLEKATQVLGAKTYSEAVNLALEETIKLYHIRQLASLTGTNIWDGDLAEMRGGDKAPAQTKSKRRKK